MGEMSFLEKFNVATVPDELAPNTSLAEAKANLAEVKQKGFKDAIAVQGDSKSSEELDAPTAFWRSPSGLSPRHVHKAVNMALQAAVLSYHNRGSIHYTEGGSRWWGIDHHNKGWRGEYPRYADCSAFVTWCLWQGLDHFHHYDNVNGLNWRGGYTGTMATHGRRVHDLRPGDAVLYGHGWPYLHTAIYTGGGLVVSHGGEIGPLLLPWNYRGDAGQIRRYI